MKIRIGPFLAVAITALAWSTGTLAAGVQQRSHAASPHARTDGGRGHEQAHEWHDSRGRWDGHDDRQGHRDDGSRWDDRRHRDRDDRDHEHARERQSSGGVVMRQPREHDRWRERSPDHGPYGGAYGPNGPQPYYRPYGPYGPYDPPPHHGR